RTPAPQPQHVLKFDRADQVDHGAAHHPDRVRFVEAQGVHVVVADVLDPPSIQARTDRHRACRGLHRGALVAEAIMRCAQATVYDNSGSKGPASWLDDRRIRRRLPRLAGRDTGAASRALADAIDRRSSNTTAGTGE